MSEVSLVEQVRSRYAAMATSGLSGSQSGVRSVAEAFGYTPEQLAAVPDEAHLGLSCGNPTATARLQPGEVVVDLGSGAGIDVLLASLAVGPTGRAIGIDMTSEMIERARAGAIKFGQGVMPDNVEFRQGRIESLPLEDASVDCLISNCVINLVPDKRAAFREMYRVMKPGGRVAISDIALKRDLPEELARSVAAQAGCVAGAIPIAEYERLVREAGFDDVLIVDTRKDLNAYARIDDATSCCGGGQECSPPTLPREMADLIARHDLNDFAASIQLYALKSLPGDQSPVKENLVTTLEVFDRPLCCSTGICGPAVDPALVHFAADLDWLRSQGIDVRRYNLAFEPAAFTKYDDVQEAMRLGQMECLPLVRLAGRIVSQGRYPGRDELAGWCGVVQRQELAQIKAGSCCGPTGCC